MAPDIDGEVKWVVWGEFARRLWGVQIQAKNRDGGGKEPDTSRNAIRLHSSLRAMQLGSVIFKFYFSSYVSSLFTPDYCKVR